MFEELLNGHEFQVRHNRDVFDRFIAHEKQEWEQLYSWYAKREPERWKYKPSEKEAAAVQRLIVLDKAELKVSTMSRNSKFSVYNPEGTDGSLVSIAIYLANRAISAGVRITAPGKGSRFYIHWRD